MLCLADERCSSPYSLRGNPCLSVGGRFLNAAVPSPGSPFRRVPVKELTSRHQSPHSASLLCIVTSSQINRRSPSTSDSTPLHIPQATTFSLMHPAVSLSAVECQTTGFTQLKFVLVCLIQKCYMFFQPVKATQSLLHCLILAMVLELFNCSYQSTASTSYKAPLGSRDVLIFLCSHQIIHSN